MIQRPQRGYGQQRGGLQQLLQPPRRLESAPHLTPFHPQGAGVAPPRPLPGLIPFGSQPQGLQQNSRFTGGNVPGGGMSLVRPTEPQIPTFKQPSFPSMPQQPQTPLAPLAALATLLTGAVGGGTRAPTGATSGGASRPFGTITPANEVRLHPGQSVRPATPGVPGSRPSVFEGSLPQPRSSSSPSQINELAQALASAALRGRKVGF